MKHTGDISGHARLLIKSHRKGIMVDLFQFMPEGQVSNSMERTSSIQADFNAVLATLEKLGQPSLTEMLIRNHSVHEPCWGETGRKLCVNLNTGRIWHGLSYGSFSDPLRV